MSRAVVDAKEFSHAMSKISKILKKCAIPILEEVCLRIQNGRCTLTATDLETWLTAELPASGDDMFFVFRKTKDILRACSHFAGELTMEFSETRSGSKKAGKILLRCERRGAEFEVYDGADYPNMPQAPEGDAFSVSSARLSACVERVRYAAEKPSVSARPAAICVQFCGNRVYALDGTRLACDTLEGVSFPKPFLVRADVLAHLSAFGKEDMTVRIGSSHVLFASGNLRMLARLQGVDTYRCNLCGAHGNSVSLYARIKGICNKEAYLELAHESKVYPLPQSPSPQTQERQPCSLEQRHAVYSDMLAHLTLLPKHGENLLERGLSEERIRRNEYRSMPETERGRRLLADLLRSHGHDLHGIPGFRTYYGDWTLSGPNGFLIPVRNKDGLIQGLKIRLDDAQQANRKYRWLSSRNLPSGTRSYSWVHVTGNTQSKRAFLTEGPLKGDVASFLAQDALFICIGGVNALNGLNDTIRSLGVREVVEAMDMDQMTNPNVRSAILTMRKEVRKIPGIRYSKYTWNPAYKGVDDYLLSQAATM